MYTQYSCCTTLHRNKVDQKIFVVVANFCQSNADTISTEFLVVKKFEK